MRIGIQFPVESAGRDPAAIKEVAQTIEGLGFDHLVLYEHIVGTTPVARPGGAHDPDTPYHEVFTLMAYLAGVTSTIELSTAVMVLPQRAAVLAAKQAAEVDILSGGRLRLGIGVGRNHIEYAALGATFADRGKRVEEQMAVMRALWTQDWVDFHGDHHDLEHVSLTMPPMQRPIPIWIGGSSDAVIRRIGRVADGWITASRVDRLAEQRAMLDEAAREAGRDPSSIGMEGRVALVDRTPDQWAADLAWWVEQGATHVNVRVGEGPVGEVLALARRFKEST